MRAVERIASRAHLFSQRYLRNSLNTIYFNTVFYTTLLLLTPISTWHYNNNRTPPPRVIPCLKLGNPRELKAPPPEGVRSVPKGSTNYRPVKTNPESPWPSVSAIQSKMRMIKWTSSTPPSRLRLTGTSQMAEPTSRTRSSSRSQT